MAQLHRSGKPRPGHPWPGALQRARQCLANALLRPRRRLVDKDAFQSPNHRRPLPLRPQAVRASVPRRFALAVLSGVSVNQFALLVQTGDVAALTKIPGIGKKTAERMVVELRDRAADFATGTLPTAAAGPVDPLSEAVIALQQLGYKPAEAERMAKKAAGEGDAAEAIIRKALQQALR